MCVRNRIKAGTGHRKVRRCFCNVVSSALGFFQNVLVVQTYEGRLLKIHGLISPCIEKNVRQYVALLP